MQSNTFKRFIAFSWVFIVSGYLVSYLLQQQLPTTILDAMSTGTKQLTFLGIYLAVLTFSFIGIWQGRLKAKYIFFASICLLLLYNFERGIIANTAIDSLFDDISNLLLGVIAALMLTQPFKQLFYEGNKASFNLATIRNLRILCGITILMFILTIAASIITDSALPQSFTDFVQGDPLEKYKSAFFLYSISFYFLNLWLLIARLRVGKYLFLIFNGLSLLVCSPVRDAVTGLDNIFITISMIMQGMLMIVIFGTPLKHEFITISEGVKRSKNLLSSYFRGTKPLWKTYWLVFFLGCYLLFLISSVFSKIMFPPSDFLLGFVDFVQLRKVILTMLIVNVPYTIFATTAVVRCALNHIRDNVKSVKSYAAIIAVSINSIGMLIYIYKSIALII